MSAPSGRPEFFALEAGEYLQELGRLLDASTPPDQRATQTARALRGAALLGGPAEFTRAASALETTIRAVNDGQISWEPGLAEQLRGTVEGLTALLHQVREWQPADGERALALAGELERRGREAGAPPPPPFGRRVTDRNQPGVRAFLAREAAIVAGAVERLARDPSNLGNPIAIENVLRTTRPLRGIAFLGEIPPLGELLDLIEQVLQIPLTGTPVAPATADALSLLAASLAGAARELTEHGTPATDSHELAGTARRIRDAVTNERDVVSIEGLFADGDTAPIVHQGTPPARQLPGAEAALPLLALAAHLTQATEQLADEAPAPLRALRETTLLLTLRAGLPPRPALPADRLVAAIARALGRGATLADPAGFLSGLRQAAAAVGALAEGVAESGAPSIAMVTGLFETLPGEVTEDDRQLVVPPPLVGAPSPMGAEDDQPIVAIESLLLESDPSHLLEETDDGIVPIESLAPEVPGAPVLDAFEASLHTYRRLLEGAPEPFLPASLPPVPRTAVAAPSTPVNAADDTVVPIEALLYRGRSAWLRADEVRREIDAIVAAFKAERRLEPLIQELLDLVPLALDESA